MSEQKLTEHDVHRLLEDGSAQARIETAAKIARSFSEGLSPKERTLAEQIFRLMLEDAEVRVREALALNLKENPSVPHDIAASLAFDEERVALPILQYSEVLTDEDLIEIVYSQSAEKQKAIARRPNVAETVSEALVDQGNEEVVATLVANPTAHISDGSLEKVVTKFGESEMVQAPLVHRAKLPVTVAERLMTRVSEHLQQHLLTHHDLPPDLAADLVMQTRERATINLSAQSSEDDVEALVRQLKQNGRLTPSIILRAACMGDIKFFEYAMAVYAAIPIVNARILIHDEGELGLNGLLQKANFPVHVFPAIRAAIDVAKETSYTGEPHDRERYSRLMIERVLTQYGDLGVEFESDDLEYLLAKMSQLPAKVIKG